MSAFEVSETHIDVLVSYALQRQGGDSLYWYFDLQEDKLPGEALSSGDDYMTRLRASRREVNRDNAGYWGALLVAENKRSVNFRYDDDEIEEPYQFTEYAGHFEPVAILAALNCYEYQSCEHPEWKVSEARAFCEALKARAIRALPGYGKVREITDAHEAGRLTAVRTTLRRLV
jgi:hypothetical protein